MSQWVSSPFTVDGIKYPTAEHWMMAEKARAFCDYESLLKIIETSSPRKAKKLGRHVQDFDEDIWNERKFQIVVQGNLHKFSQNPIFLRQLLDTGEKVLVEASPYDKIWGIGLGEDAKDLEFPRNWKGQNLLGFALMNARYKLKEQQESE